MDLIPEEQIYATIGEAGFTELVGAFYRRVRVDNLLGKMYPPDDFEAAELRLREFIIQRFGGPGRYSQARGHPRLRMRHAPFAVDLVARNRWIELMEAAMVEVKLPPAVELVLRKYFRDTATAMINQAKWDFLAIAPATPPPFPSTPDAQLAARSPLMVEEQIVARASADGES